MKSDEIRRNLDEIGWNLEDRSYKNLDNFRRIQMNLDEI
jgi:hypothetical protein